MPPSAAQQQQRPQPGSQKQDTRRLWDVPNQNLTTKPLLEPRGRAINSSPEPWNKSFAAPHLVRNVAVTPDGRQIYGAVPSQNTVLAFSADTIETPREGLAHAWSGDGTPNDQVENIHGELCNGAGFAPGVRGAAFRFDGSDDFAWFGRPRMLLLESGADTFTTWVRFDELDGEMTVADARVHVSKVGIWRVLLFWPCFLRLYMP